MYPFSIATSVSFDVTVGFDDESSKSFSSDPRTVFAVVRDGFETLVELQDDNTITVRPDAIIAADSTANVHVSFPGTFDDLSATESVSVVELVSLSVSSQPYPPVGSFSGDVDELKLISCSSVYQRLEATATAQLSDGTEQTSSSFYQRVSFVSSNTNVADFTSAPSYGGIDRGLVATQAGETTVTGSFGGLSASMAITVADTQVAISGLTIADSIGSSSTLKGLVGTSDTMKVTATFEDGTAIHISASGQTSSSWLSPSSLLNFSSAVESAVTVSSEGVVQLDGNYHDTVELSAADKCGSGTTTERDIFANLEADVHDVDLGSQTGAPFGFVNEGDSFDVSVRVQGSSSYDVTAFQIVVTFDSSVVQVSSDADCSQGGGWSSSFECTTNDPVNEMLLVGSCGLSPSSGCGSNGRPDRGDDQVHSHRRRYDGYFWCDREDQGRLDDD